MTANNPIHSMVDDLRQQTLMVNPPVNLVSEIQSSVNSEKDIPSADILQQALNEADEYDQSPLVHTQSKILQENIQHLTDHSYIHTSKPDNLSAVNVIDTQNINDVADLEISTVVDKEKQNLQFETNTCLSDHNSDNLISHPFPEDAYKLGKNNDDLDMEVGDTVDILDETVLNSNSLIISENSDNPVIPPSIAALNPQYIFKVKDTAASVTPATSSFIISQLKLPPKQTTAPLGSVGNPIQIIQNGNSYHSTQLLTQAQLQQISHVLQRQQTKKVQNGGKSVMFDPSTNTRIVCRVVHPTDLQDKNSVKEDSNLTSPVRGEISSRGRGRPKKPFNRRRDEDDKLAHLSKEEREERKKHRPRTRSGRISKPPSYMVKDYKRIHHLDFDEEPLNDSDGGYSDYQVSDEEGGRSGSKAGSLPPGVTTSKQRNYSCPSCNKAYIGRGGLSRHYRLYPTHGRMPEGEDVSTQDENSNSSLASSILSSSGGYTNNQNNSNLVPQASARLEIEAPSSLSSQLTTINPQDSSSFKRKSKLREILRSFPEEDLIEVALPKIAERVPLWDFFYKKCDEKSDSLRIYEMLKEFEIFLAELQRVSHEYLSPASLEDDQRRTIINISSKQIAEALSLQTGAYFVKDSSNPPSSSNLPVNHFTPQPCTTRDLISPHIKRKRIDPQNVEDITAKLPEQILSDTHEDVFCSMNSDPHDSMNATLIHSEAQSDIPKGSLFDLNNSTTVTPSSLSSGCLTAVDSTSASMFFSADGAHAQVLQNIQVRKVQLLGSDSQQQQLSARVAGSSYSIPSEFSLTDLAETRELSANQRQMEVDGNSAMRNTRAYETLNLGPSLSVLNSCQEVPQTIGLCSNSSLLQSLVNVSSVSNVHNIHNGDLIINGQNIQSPTEVSNTSADCLPLTDAISQSLGITGEDEVQTCLPSDVPPNSSALDVASRELELTHNEMVSEAAKPIEPSQVLRHLMLPDGQVIGVWSQVDSPEKSVNNQLIQNFLPGNLIILQNSDGSLQVPSNQNVTLETLQTLVSVEPGQTTQTFTTV